MSYLQRTFSLNAYMASCRARDEVRGRTIENLYASGWTGRLTVELDDARFPSPLERNTALVRRVLRRATEDAQPVFLFLEDDLDFNRHLLQNLAAWQPMRQVTSGRHFFASLYNPGVTFVQSFPNCGYAEASVASVFGSQALLIGKATAYYLLTCWGVESSTHSDIRVARLAARICPLLYHVPSLVQHLGTESLWGGPFHRAVDFDKDWTFPAQSANENV